MHLYPKRACLEGLEMEIFKLVSHSATPEQWEEWLQVPLEHATARGNHDLFNKLLGAGANASAGWRGCRGRTLLDAATVVGNEDVLSELLEAGAQSDVNFVSSSSKRSALYTATMLGHEAVARRLVVAGAGVNFQDPIDGWSVLHEAIYGQHELIVAELLIGGAIPNLQASDDGIPPLHLAAEHGFGGVVSTLLLRGANLDALDDDEETPLVRACFENGQLPVGKTLLAAGADVHARRADGYSALDRAASRGHVDTLRAVLGHGADVNADFNGFTALHNAALHDRAGAVDALVKAGADVESKTIGGSTPLLSSAYLSASKGILALLRHGASIDVRDKNGHTPLHNTCFERFEGGEAAVDLLLRWGADETALNDAGKSPAEMLDVDMGKGVDSRSTQDEIYRTRLLVTRAPADRTWRRRGWLVMLRSRGSKARTASSDGDDENGGGSSGSDCDRQGGRNKVARTHSKGGGESGVHDNVGAGSGTDSGGAGWSGVVELLLGLEMEGVFAPWWAFCEEG